MTDSYPCPLFVEWVENWAPDYLPSGPDDVSGDFNVTQRTPCGLSAGHTGPCRIPTPCEMWTPAAPIEP